MYKMEFTKNSGTVLRVIVNRFSAFGQCTLILIQWSLVSRNLSGTAEKFLLSEIHINRSNHFQH